MLLGWCYIATSWPETASMEGDQLEEWEPSRPFVFVGYFRLPDFVCDVLGVPSGSLWRTDFGWDVWRSEILIMYTKCVDELYYGDVPPDSNDPRPPPPLPPPEPWDTRRRWLRMRRHIIVGCERANVYEAGSATSPWVRLPSMPPPPLLLH